MADQPKFTKLDEGVFADLQGRVFEERDGKMVPTGAKRPKAGSDPTPTKAIAVPGALQPGPLQDVSPVMDIAAAKKLWDQFQEFKSAIIEAGDFDKIGDKKDLNRSGWMKLAAAFAVSVEQLEEMHDIVDGEPYWQFRVRASKGARYADGVGIASLSETNTTDPLGKRMHNAITKAYTRAAKRAIADLLGGAEVSE